MSASLDPQRHRADVARSLEKGAAFWNPPWLQRGTLLGLVALFIYLIASLVAIFVASEQKYGLSSPQSKYHYVWTYGLTIGEFAMQKSPARLTHGIVLVATASLVVAS